ncbi:unnamed protein product [Effrenium voratum]|uniref:Dienelactone hydrolase domain-containing protein n=1 Tax=Effrenium voratum TaxID=2562239 RepID=A0AA36J9X6_9DINO|nr:unnamed protein product [Effrenium voratum]CAJ1417466.1 unnamed protein product [Effrenium voratum]
MCCPAGAEPYLAPEHTDEGNVGEVDGVRYYAVGRSSLGLLFLPDVWGWNGGRTRALADEFAQRGGLSVWVPKVLEPYQGGTDDDGLPPDFDLLTRRSEYAPAYFQGCWNPEKTLPMVLKVVDAMKAAGVVKFGVLGVCYGAWLGFHLSKARPDQVVCGISPHPAVHLESVAGGDALLLAAQVACPWAFFPAGDPSVDGGVGADPAIYDAEGELFRKLEEKLPGKNLTKRYREVRHGFFARGAIKDGWKAGDGDQVRQAVADCFADCAAFLQAHGIWKPEPSSWKFLARYCCGG